jgi:hypothetical protein
VKHDERKFEPGDLVTVMKGERAMFEGEVVRDPGPPHFVVVRSRVTGRVESLRRASLRPKRTK